MRNQVKYVETRRLYQQVADQIRELIESGYFPAGSRLPPERDLAQQLGVSRPSLREALIALEIAGIVEIRMGSGVYVCTAIERSVNALVAMGDSPTELMQARWTIEGAVILLACARVTPEALGALRANLVAMKAEIEQGRPPLEHDRQFHVNIATMTGNSVLVRLVGELFDERHSPISAHLSARFESKSSWTAAVHEHEAICAGMEAADPLTAQAAMHHHLQASKERWTGS